MFAQFAISMLIYLTHSLSQCLYIWHTPVGKNVLSFWNSICLRLKWLWEILGLQTVIGYSYLPNTPISLSLILSHIKLYVSLPMEKSTATQLVSTWNSSSVTEQFTHWISYVSHLLWSIYKHVIVWFPLKDNAHF